MKSKFICRKPGPKSVKIIDRDRKVISPSLTREYSFVFKKAKDCYVWDADGRKYLDFAAGVAVMNIGHSNPVIEKALHKQIKLASHAAFSDFYAELPVKFVEYLLTFLPKHLNKAFLSNSGTEAVEAAYKLARWHKNKKWTIAFKPSFHGRCYDKETEVLTKRGWKYFKDISYEDEIITLNLENYTIEYQNPSQIFVYDCDGELIHFKNASLDLMVTPNHMMLVQNKNDKLEFCEASKIRDKMKIPRFAKWGGVDKEFFVLPSIQIEKKTPQGLSLMENVPEKLIPMDSWLKFLGIWLAEGWTSQVEGWNYQVGIAQKDPVISERIDQMLKEIGLNYSKYQTEKGYQYRINGEKQLWQYLSQFGDSSSKFIPTDIKELPATKLKILLEWMLLGDGTLDRSNRKIYFTSSKRLADDVQEIFLKIGSNARIYWRKRLTTFSKSGGTFYEIRERKRAFHRISKRRGKYNPIRKVRYKGPVYCCEVPNHVIYVRRNGFPLWCGNSMGALSLTNAKPVQKERFEPFLPVKHALYPYCYRCPFGNKEHDGCTNLYLDVLEQKISECNKDLAAIFMEPIVGEPGYIVPPKDFVKGVRELCDKYDVLLCDDEVQAGCYRTGKFLAMENFDVKPDIVALSKAIGGGIPLGATVANERIMNWVPGVHANTFGGNLLACASGIVTLKFMREKRLGENAIKIGNYMMKRLEEMKENYEIIGDVRGIGLMIGVEIVKDKKSKEYGIKERTDILCKASEKGLLLLPAGTSSIRICPPLILTKEQVDLGLDIFEDSVKEIV